jgi:hypothetical protein
MRHRFLEARTNKDDDSINRLAVAFGVISETAFIEGYTQLSLLIDEFTDSANDYGRDEEWKSYIPTEDEIRKLTA